MVGIARRPFDPAEQGWTKMEYRRGDVREPDALEEAFAGADVVVHLAFMITGSTASRDTIRAINVEGTLNAFRAAAAAGAKRFVYASSVAAYGFHRDNPVGMTEEWPVRPAAHLFYAQEKAEIEALLADEAPAHPELGLYLLRPPVVLGPHAAGGKEFLPGPLGSVGRGLGRLVTRSPVPIPALAPALPVQFIHEEDVGQAFLLCIVGAGPPGAYNITGDGVLTGRDVARELGLAPLPVPGGGSERRRARLARLRTAVPPARGGVGRGGEPPVDHGREQGQAGARLEAALHEPRGAARHDRRSMMMPAVDTFDVDIAIIGSGFSGLGMAIRLKQEGIEDFTVLERGDDVGGTWHFNTYPGCACDVPSHLYSFSFAPNPGLERDVLAPARDPRLPAARRRRVRRARARAPQLHVNGIEWDEAGRLDRRDLGRAAPRARRRLRHGAAGRAQDAAARGPRHLRGRDVPLRALEPRLRPQGQARRRGRHRRVGDPVRARDPEGRRAAARDPAHARRGSCRTRTGRSARWEARLYERFPPLQKLVRGTAYSFRELLVLGFVKNPRLMKLPERIARRHMRSQISDPALLEKVSPGYTIGCKRILPSNTVVPRALPAQRRAAHRRRRAGHGELGRDRRRRGARGRRDHLRHRLPGHRHAGRADRARAGRQDARRGLAGQPQGPPRDRDAGLPEPVRAAAGRTPASGTPRWST